MQGKALEYFYGIRVQGSLVDNHLGCWGRQFSDLDVYYSAESKCDLRGMAWYCSVLVSACRPWGRKEVKELTGNLTRMLGISFPRS